MKQSHKSDVAVVHMQVRFLHAVAEGGGADFKADASERHFENEQHF